MLHKNFLIYDRDLREKAEKKEDFFLICSTFRKFVNAQENLMEKGVVRSVKKNGKYKFSQKIINFLDVGMSVFY